MRPNRLTLPHAATGALRTMRERASQRAEAEGRTARPWYRIEAAGSDAVVYIYDEISYFGITASDFVKEINGITAGEITVHINSPGGFVDDGIAIFNALRDHPARITTINDASALSIASVIMQAGDRRVANRHSMMMVHDALSFLDVFGFFNQADLLTIEGDVRALRQLVDKTSDVLSGVYVERAGGSAGEWRSAMLATTWYTAEEALAAGLVDELVSTAGGETSDRFARSALFQSFRNKPEHLLHAPPQDGREVTKREAEQALRDAGLPVAAAKAVLAGGWEGIGGAARDERDLANLATFIRGISGGRA